MWNIELLCPKCGSICDILSYYDWRMGTWLCTIVPQGIFMRSIKRTTFSFCGETATYLMWILPNTLLLPMENQVAWLRSVKEAIQVRKQHDDYPVNFRKEWFKSFFVTQPSSSALPRPNTNTAPREQALPKQTNRSRCPDQCGLHLVLPPSMLL